MLSACPPSAGRDRFVCCVDLAGPEGRGRLSSPLLSPVGFDSFDVTHQVLSEADAKNLEKESHTGQETAAENGPECSMSQTAVLQGLV